MKAHQENSNSVLTRMKRKPFIATGLVVMFAVVGVLLLARSQAATTSMAVEAERGTISGNADTLTNQVGASGESSVQFGSQAAGACENSDGSACPASYFTGPLGKNNIVPSKRGAFLISQYGGVGTEWPQVKTGVQQREQAMGRKFDSVHFSSMADPTQNGDRESWIVSNGASFVTVAWTPSYDIAAINRGDYDAVYAKAANYWKQFSPTRIMVRHLTEFNLNSSIVNGGQCGAPFQQAWQRMVRIFQQNGASNVGFWYNMDEGNARQCVIDSYPGDQYVDWVGSDSYNWCLVGANDCYSTPVHAGPAQWEELFNYSKAGSSCASGSCPRSQHDIFGPKKPFVVGETGTAYDPAHPEFKIQFFTNLTAGARNMKYLRGVSFFDQDVTAMEGGVTNWRIDEPKNNPGVFESWVQNVGKNDWFWTRK